MKKVFVCCPGGLVTGGPELLHQFVDALRTMSVDASIIYYPFDANFTITERYKSYDVDVAKISMVRKGDVVVLPEVKTSLAKYFKGAKLFVWWLSVDNYFEYTGGNRLSEKVKFYLRLMFGRQLSLLEMKRRGFLHLTQSEYANLFLQQHGIKSYMLTDYLNETHLTQEVDLTKKEKIIAYNPKKGFSHTKKLIDKYKDLCFIPIQNMTPTQVRSLLQSSMVYIDFGQHPGKDRFPREAAMAGCCIVTGVEGSALNNKDICIPLKYKIDSYSADFELNFLDVINSIFNDFNSVSHDFDGYREIIKCEKSNFDKQVEKFIVLNNLLGE
jgi:hypothetical protein